jgi:hypothetical protein
MKGSGLSAWIGVCYNRGHQWLAAGSGGVWALISSLGVITEGKASKEKNYAMKVQELQEVVGLTVKQKMNHMELPLC